MSVIKRWLVNANRYRLSRDQITLLEARDNLSFLILTCQHTSLSPDKRVSSNADWVAWINANLLVADGLSEVNKTQIWFLTHDEADTFVWCARQLLSWKGTKPTTSQKRAARLWIDVDVFEGISPKRFEIHPELYMELRRLAISIEPQHLSGWRRRFNQVVRHCWRQDNPSNDVVDARELFGVLL